MKSNATLPLDISSNHFLNIAHNFFLIEQMPSLQQCTQLVQGSYLRPLPSSFFCLQELEMWDEVVTCFQLLQKPHRAELLVRERLAAGEETPYMLCSLADLTKVCFLMTMKRD